MLRLLCATAFVFAASFLFVATAASSSPPSSPRDISLFGSLFQWFEAAFEILFGYFIAPSVTPEKSIEDRKDSRVSYWDYQVLRVRPMTEDALIEVESLEDEPGLEFWKTPMRNRTTDILVPPDMAQHVRQYLADKDIEFTVLSHNVEVDLRKQNNKMTKNQRTDLKNSKGHPMTWNRFHRYNDIEDYIDYLVTFAPHLVDVFKIGRSTEGRSLKVVRVSTGKQKEKPAIWIDAGIHGREWITPSVAMFILKQLVENYQSNKGLIDDLDWYIMPLANPDGYEYSHTTDRFWRKNRGANKEAQLDDDLSEDEDDVDSAEVEDDSSEFRGRKRRKRRGRIFWGGGTCRGVDLNRNFDYHWGESGSSDNPCHPTYAGSKPLSEPESKAIAEFIMEHKDQMKAYLTLHSYSQMWLVPWGYTKQKPKDYDDLLYLGRKAVEALSRVHGTQYRIGPSSSLLYPISGSSEDWAKGRAGIKYSYSIELRDQGTFGFMLPASQIMPTSKETFAAIRTVAKAIINKLV